MSRDITRRSFFASIAALVAIPILPGVKYKDGIVLKISNVRDFKVLRIGNAEFINRFEYLPVVCGFDRLHGFKGYPRDGK